MLSTPVSPKDYAFFQSGVVCSDGMQGGTHDLIRKFATQQWDHHTIGTNRRCFGQGAWPSVNIFAYGPVPVRTGSNPFTKFEVSLN